ncbi:unnamed protein product [Miscanthus lutarioriparius]|uniref:Uncharacterized protein n=1 Tax=Miscanthus lutarioriparius TaxID=422564 RepID=A0A811MZB2_9POAL|nr:unnamed protein product [Miscanthus lutarioriparius]
MPGKGRQTGPRAIGEGAAAAAATGAGQKRRRGREGRSGRRREEEVAVEAGAAGGEVGVAIAKVCLEGGEIRGCPEVWRLELWSLSGLGPCCSPPAGGGRADGWTWTRFQSQLSLLRACDAGGRLVAGWRRGVLPVKDAGKREIRSGRDELAWDRS